MADAARAAQAAFLAHDGPEQLVGMDRAFHDRVGFAGQHERDGAVRCCAGVHLLDEAPGGNVDVELCGRCRNAFAVADQDRLDEAGLDRELDAAERVRSSGQTTAVFSFGSRAASAMR